MVVQQLLEFCGRYLVGRQVLPVIVIPIELDFAGHNSILYRNVYTLHARAMILQKSPGVGIQRNLPDCQ